MAVLTDFKMSLSLIKKYWLFALLAFVATILFAAKLFLPAPQEVKPIPAPVPSAPSWNGITPGQTTTQKLPELIGTPEPKETVNDQTTYDVQRQGGGPPHEIITQDGTVGLVKDRVLSGNISLFKQKYGAPEGEYWGEHQSVGFKTYVWPKNGIAAVAHAVDGSLYEVWYFQPTTLQAFLSTWGKGLTTEPQQNTGY